MKTKHLCLPKFGLTTTASPATCGRNNRGFSPMSLLDRLREAVFRIIMLSTLSSKAANPQTHDGDEDRARRCCYNYLNDPRQSEAVADCIEFIKKKAGTTPEENRDSSASGGSI